MNNHPGREITLVYGDAAPTFYADDHGDTIFAPQFKGVLEGCLRGRALAVRSRRQHHRSASPFDVWPVSVIWCRGLLNLGARTRSGKGPERYNIFLST
jgi:hypothetical protein